MFTLVFLMMEIWFLMNPAPISIDDTLVLCIPVPITSLDTIVDRKEVEHQVTVQIITDHIVNTNKNLSADTAEEYANYIYDASVKWNLDPMILTSLIHHESRFNKHSVNSVTGAIGLTQILWKYHKNGLTSSFSTISKKDDLLDHKNSIYGGAWIYWCYKKSNNGNIRKALARYCPGSKKYVNMVLDLADRLKKQSIERIGCLVAYLR